MTDVDWMASTEESKYSSLKHGTLNQILIKSNIDNQIFSEMKINVLDFRFKFKYFASNE